MINSVPVLVLFLELELKYKIMVLKLFLVPVLRTGTTLLGTFMYVKGVEVV